MIMKKQRQPIFLTVKKNPPLHSKTCKSCPFHDTLLNIDKIIENNFKRLIECFDKSNSSNTALISDDIKQELITHGVISKKYSNYPIILKRE